MSNSIKILVVTSLLLAIGQGCALVDLERMAYDVISKQECRINNPGSFCERSYSLDYLEYKQLLNEFHHDQDYSTLKKDLVDQMLVARELEQEEQRVAELD